MFGKTPQTGDFVVRNMDRGTRQALDRWLTAHLVPFPPPWPDGGLRGLIDLNERLFLMAAVPSRDAAGRRFPLAAITDGAGVSLETAEAWCEVVVGVLERAAGGELCVDDLARDVAAFAIADRSADDGFPALWTAGRDPVTCDAMGLSRLFSSD